MRAMLLFFVALALVACEVPPSSDRVQQRQQETILAEGTSKIGMPSITNFRERKLLRDILEMRDKADFATYTYRQAEYSGALVFLCESVGYPLPYSTQFTNPQKVEWSSGGHYWTLPQADPNGLFSPPSAEATWVVCKDPHSKGVGVLYSEPKLIVSPFKLQ